MSKNPVHLYRALLRECTYLPDPNSRPFIKKWVRDRFRRYTPRKVGKIWREPVKVTPDREQVVLSKASRFLSTLRRANYGHCYAYKHVLRWTYGRLGVRRRQMMANVLDRERPKLKEKGTDQGEDEPEPFSLEWRPSPFLMALMRAQQISQNFLTYQGGSLAPDFPRKLRYKRTIWRRPWPLCRVRNEMKKWYARSLRLIQLPLPEKEREYIKAIATGQQQALVLSRRRPQATILVFSAPRGPLDLTDPIRGRTGRPTQQPRNPKQSRFLRRRMAELLVHIPLITLRKGDSTENPVIAFERVEKFQIKIEEPNEEKAKMFFGRLG
jgi:hypothetical protein